MWGWGYRCRQVEGDLYESFLSLHQRCTSEILPLALTDPIDLDVHDWGEGGEATLGESRVSWGQAADKRGV